MRLSNESAAQLKFFREHNEPMPPSFRQIGMLVVYAVCLFLVSLFSAGGGALFSFFAATYYVDIRRHTTNKTLRALMEENDCLRQDIDAIQATLPSTVRNEETPDAR